jgi:hypothetical protein
MGELTRFWDVSYDMVSFDDGIYYLNEDYFISKDEPQIPSSWLMVTLASHFYSDICSVIVSYSDGDLRLRYQQFSPSRAFLGKIGPRILETRWNKLIPHPIKIILDSQHFSENQQLNLLALLGRLHWPASHRQDAWDVRLHLHGKAATGKSLLVYNLANRRAQAEHLNLVSAQQLWQIPLNKNRDRIIMSNLETILPPKSHDAPFYYHVPFRFTMTPDSMLYRKLQNAEAETFRCITLCYNVLLKMVGPNNVDLWSRLR